jgi:uridine monophosphate synthetase
VDNNLGLVVGATQVNSIARVRQNDPGIWILAPGIGAQGGDLKQALKAGLREDGLGMLIPVSRSISRSDDPRQEAHSIRDAINDERASLRQSKRVADVGNLSALQRRIATGLIEIGCIQFGEFTLKSGDISPIYFDLRRLIAHPEFLLQVAAAYTSLLKPLEFDHLAALPYAGLPITSAISLQGGWSMIYPRKEEKTYGTKALVEGVFSEGDTAVVIDDLITTGGSKLEGILKLTENGLNVRDIVVLIDRSKQARKFLDEKDYSLHAFLTIAELLDYFENMKLVKQGLITRSRRFLEDY